MTQHNDNLCDVNEVDNVKFDPETSYLSSGKLTGSGHSHLHLPLGGHYSFYFRAIRHNGVNMTLEASGDKVEKQGENIAEK